MKNEECRMKSACRLAAHGDKGRRIKDEKDRG
jgi:hypothetical protein